MSGTFNYLSAPLNMTLGLSDMHTEIENRLNEGFERQLFRAALANLGDTDNPLRFNNFAYATRELVRHILGRLGPDEEVLKCSWYKDETGKKNGVSRRQRVYYAVQGGLSDEYAQNELGIDILAIHSALRDAVDNLSKHTHIEEKTFNIEDRQVNIYVEEILAAVVGLFTTIEDNHKALVSALWDRLDESTIDAALRETILAIDELATHHTIEEVYTDKIQIVDIDSYFVRFEARGTISCELQWGSNSDLRRGDGAVLPQSFPFMCELWSPVDNPQDIQTNENAFGADTSSWRNGHYDEET